MDKVYIYALLDPDTGEAHYIGATTDIDRRMTEHLSPDIRKSKEKAKWIMGLLSQDKRPILSVLEECNGKTWKDAECRWIEKYQSMNAPLKNVQKGGGGGTSAQRQRYLKAMRESKPDVKIALPAFFAVHLEELVRKKAAKEGHYITQVQIHEATGIHYQIVSLWYGGIIEKLDARVVLAFMTYLKCKMSDLVSLPTVYEDLVSRGDQS